MDLTPDQLTRAADALADFAEVDLKDGDALDVEQAHDAVQRIADALWPGWTGQPRAPLAGPYQLHVVSSSGDLQSSGTQWVWRLVLATPTTSTTVATSEPYGTEDQAAFMGRLLTGLVPA